MSKCLCGHNEESHLVNRFKWLHCEKCYQQSVEPFYPVFHAFKLDNLQYVEDLAKEKGII